MTNKKINPDGKGNFTKAQEIEMLEALAAADTYFADTFQNDVPLMCQNIRNDFPILTGTSIDNSIAEHTKTIACFKIKVEGLEAALKRTGAVEVQQRNRAMAAEARLEEILDYMLGCNFQAIQTDPNRMFSINEVVAAKVRKNMGLNQNEKDYILTKINEK